MDPPHNSPDANIPALKSLVVDDVEGLEIAEDDVGDERMLAFVVV